MPRGLKVSNLDNGNLVARLYQTDIVELKDGVLTLRHGGYKGPHTKKCINLALEPYGIYVRQINYKWLIMRHGEYIGEMVDDTWIGVL